MFSKNSFRNTIKVSNSLDLGQTGPTFCPDLGPNYLQRLSTDDKNRRYQGKRMMNSLIGKPQAGTGSKLFDTLMVFLKESFDFFKKNQ